MLGLQQRTSWLLESCPAGWLACFMQACAATRLLLLLLSLLLPSHPLTLAAGCACLPLCGGRR
jgi:hypothetical protein